MNVFLREMRANRKSLIFWSIGLLFMIWASMGKYSAMGTSNTSINDMMNSLPKVMKAVFGVGNFDLSKASGFYAMIILYLLIMAGIHAGMLGANIIAKEERDKTTEFLYVKPASRTSILTYKLAAALTNVIIFNIITLILSIGIVNMYAKGEAVNKAILLLMLGMFFVQLIFLSLGAFLAATGRNPKIAGSAVTGILLCMYLLSVCMDLTDKLDILKYVTPFRYFDTSKIVKGGGLELISVGLSLIITAILSFFTYKNYTSRDLRI